MRYVVTDHDIVQNNTAQDLPQTCRVARLEHRQYAPVVSTVAAIIEQRFATIRLRVFRKTSRKIE